MLDRATELNPKPFVPRHSFSFSKHRVYMAGNEDLRQQLITDTLTGLPNEQGTILGFNQLMHQFSRESSSEFNYLMIAIFDAKHFKAYNDLLSDTEGDNFLIQFAKLLKSTFRKEDLKGRLHGDTFIFVGKINHPSTEFKQNDKIVEKLSDLSRKSHKAIPPELRKAYDKSDPNEIIDILRLFANASPEETEWENVYLGALNAGVVLFSHNDLLQIFPPKGKIPSNFDISDFWKIQLIPKLNQALVNAKQTHRKDGGLFIGDYNGKNLYTK